MNKEYNETKVKPAISTSQEPEKINGSKAQNALSKKRKLEINFDDEKYSKKYGEKISQMNQQLPEQEPLKLRNFLKSIPIVGGFLVKIFIPEKEAYKKSQSQAGYSSKAKDETYIDDKRTEEIDSKLEKGNVEQVDNKKNRNP